MSSTWSHPRLGTLEHDDIWWRREIVIPSLKPFTYVEARKYRSTSWPYELWLECDAEDMQPTEQMASLVVTVLENESRLIPKMLHALWLDLNGRGPESGMWWHGDLPNAYRGGNWASGVHDSLIAEGLPVPNCPDDLMKILEPIRLTIRRDFSLPEQWVAEFNFHSGFEVEHGVGVLTDGAEILGIGYNAEADRFKK
jgi:hypothetical protein